MNNYIQNLHVKDFRLFKSLDVEFNPKFNFIVGPNGVGKTSLLRALILCFSTNNRDDSRYGKDFEVWADVLNNLNEIRIGIGRSNNSIENEYRSRPSLAFNTPQDKSGRKSYIVESASSIKLAPLVLGAYRKIEYTKIAGMKREDNLQEEIDYYINISPASLYGVSTPNTKQWMINRYFQMEKDWAEIERKNWQWLMKSISILFPSSTNFRFRMIKRDLEPVFEINGKQCYLEEVSAGFQSVLSMVLSIFEWIEKTNSGDMMRVSNAQGTVIIDELDVHLHPEWQLTLREALEHIFPKLQFIVTTHSPHLIATAREGEIILMPKNCEEMNLKPLNKSFSGWTTDQILEDIMGVTSLKNKEYSKLVSKAMDLVQEKNIEELEKLIKEIALVTHPDDTIVSVLKIKIASLKLNMED